MMLEYDVADYFIDLTSCLIDDVHQLALGILEKTAVDIDAVQARLQNLHNGLRRSDLLGISKLIVV
jgi:hypothetical protein